MRSYFMGINVGVGSKLVKVVEEEYGEFQVGGGK